MKWWLQAVPYGALYIRNDCAAGAAALNVLVNDTVVDNVTYFGISNTISCVRAEIITALF